MGDEEATEAMDSTAAWEEDELAARVVAMEAARAAGWRGRWRRAAAGRR